MSSTTCHLSLISLIYYGLVAICCASPTLAIPSEVLRDLGSLGDTYSFRMNIDSDNVDQVMSRVFTANNAVQHAQLSSISGGGNPGENAARRTDELAISVGNNGLLVSYAYRTPGALEHSVTFGTLDFVNVDQSTPNGTYSYARDIENNLWWAIPG